MANLLSIVQEVFEQLQAKGGDEVAIQREAMLVYAKSQYSYQMQLFYWAEKQREGTAEIPSHILQQDELDVVDNEIDISELDIFSSFGIDQWLANIGGLTCQCQYVKSSVNRAQLLCGFDSVDDNVRPYIPLGKKIIFPNGTHAKKLKIIYAATGKRIKDTIEVDDNVAAIVHDKLLEKYLGKVPPVDSTNNSNPNR